MNNRKTKVVSARLDTWMAEGIDIALENATGASRTDYLKNLVAEDLRRQGITPATVYARRTARGREGVQRSLDRD